MRVIFYTSTLGTPQHKPQSPRHVANPFRHYTVSGGSAFGGPGGNGLGLHQAGHSTKLLCEVDLGRAASSRTRFGEGITLELDIRLLDELYQQLTWSPPGFRAKTLVKPGKRQGFEESSRASLTMFFALFATTIGQLGFCSKTFHSCCSWIAATPCGPLTEQLGANGFTWAYRVVDTRAFGLPQRRQRVIMLASRTEDPSGVLFNEQADPVEPKYRPDLACGFYWTEGNRGLGWAVDAVPTLKGGSTIGIPSPPAIWMPNNEGIVVPDIRDVERLQGFPADWTSTAVGDGVRRNAQWKLVGNAVSVPVARWIGERLRSPASDIPRIDERLAAHAPWPRGAWGRKGETYRVDTSPWPVAITRPHLSRVSSTFRLNRYPSEQRRDSTLVRWRANCDSWTAFSRPCPTHRETVRRRASPDALGAVG